VITRDLLFVVSASLGAAAAWALGRRAAHESLASELDEIRASLAALERRIDGRVAGAPPHAIERVSGRQGPVVPAESPPAGTEAGEPTEAYEPVTEEELVMLGAAVAAFLGKTTRIRSARRVVAATMNAWSVQGRVAHHGSHTAGAAHRR
jgi:methylmalonyl-CoA carboxyltransferase 12S subunit